MKIKIIILVLLITIISIIELENGSEIEYVYQDQEDEKIEDNTGNISSAFLFPDTETNVPIVKDKEIGHIRIDNTLIDFPVVQADDNEYYLNHSFNDTKDICGAIFMDYKADENSRNKVIYGHNMGKGRTEMFSTLIYFENSDYCKNHERLIFTDINNKSEVYILYSVMNFDVSNLNSFDYMVTEFSDKHIGYINDNSLYINDSIGGISTQDSFITLSTCNRKYGENNRLILFFKKI